MSQVRFNFADVLAREAREHLKREQASRRPSAVGASSDKERAAATTKRHTSDRDDGHPARRNERA